MSESRLSVLQPLKQPAKRKKKDKIINKIKYNHSLCIGLKKKIPFQNNTERRRIVRHKRDNFTRCRAYKNCRKIRERILSQLLQVV